MKYDPRFRRTKIVATVGPASRDESTLEAMISAGVNVLRVNSSHGTAESRAELMERIRTVRERMQQPVGILVDLQGPRIRVGQLREPHSLVVGSEVVFAPEHDAGSDEIPTTYAALAEDLSVGARILLDDGLLEVEATAIEGTRVRGRVIHGGELKSHKGINLPGVVVTARAVSEKDHADIALAREHG
ncbi:MAG: pyruvate kinase, partial [Gemmatimonadetes bacterium]|nr:pyruvate kinase [Gemmatimonadota bacterium]